VIFSCFVLHLLSPIILVCIVYLGKSDGVLGLVGYISDFAAYAYGMVGWNLFKKRHAGHVYIWFFLVIVSTIEIIISLLFWISCLSILPSFLHFPNMCRLVDF
jgi:hypothetical protein